MTGARDALARLLAALDAWDADLHDPKVNLGRSQLIDGELEEAREVARETLEIEP